MRLDEVILRDTRANQPAATTVAAGTLFYVSDEAKTERSTGTVWEDVSDGVTAAPHDLLGSGEHSDTVTHTAVRGDIIVANSTPKWAALAKGTAGQILTMGANDPAWAAAPSTGIPDPIATCIFWEDFLVSNINTSGISPVFISFGTGSPYPIPSEANHPGLYEMSVSSGAGGFYLNGQTANIDLSALFDITIISRIFSNTNNKMRVGLFKSTAAVTSDPPADGIYVEFLAASDSNFFGVTRASSTSTRVDSGIAKNMTFNKFRIRRIDSSTIGFTVNAGTEVTSTTNIPTGFGIPLLQLVTTSGAKEIDIDLFKITIPVTR